MERIHQSTTLNFILRKSCTGEQLFNSPLHGILSTPIPFCIGFARFEMLS
jgi:hypothetical protein